MQEGLAPPPTEAADSAIVGVVAPTASAVPIEGLTLSPTSATLAPGASVTFTPLGWLHGGGDPVIASVTWTATGGTITSGGVYTAGNTPGSYQVTAASTTSWNIETAQITISGTAVVITRLNQSPTSVTLVKGATQQFTASADLSNGSTQGNPTVTWWTSRGTISSTGLYKAPNLTGSFTVIGRATNGLKDTSRVTVTSGTTTVTGITLSPSSATLNTGATRQFTVSATLSNGTTQSNPAVNWSATGGSVSSGGLYTAGGSAGSYRVIASSSNGKADTSAITITASTPPPSTPPPSTPPPPSGPNGMYFNSSEPGCGSDGNVLLCDDFEDGDWYTKNYDQAMSSGGLLQTDGWGGTIYSSISPAGAAVCGGKGYRSNCAATSGGIRGNNGNIADHSFNGNTSVNEAYFRLYFQPQSDYEGGHEKMFDFLYGGVGSAQMMALCYNYFGNETIGCIPYLHQDGGLAPDGQPSWVLSNAGPELKIQKGHWYAFQLHVSLNTPGQYNGTLEWFLDDCTVSACSTGGKPTLRGRSTSVMYRGSGESSLNLKGIWIENWSNPASSGTMYYDLVKVSRVGPIGF